MGFAEWVEVTSGYRREEAETKAERQKWERDYCRTKLLDWARVVFACEGGVGRGIRWWVQWRHSMEGPWGLQRTEWWHVGGRSSILTYSPPSQQPSPAYSPNLRGRLPWVCWTKGKIIAGATLVSIPTGGRRGANSRQETFSTQHRRREQRNPQNSPPESVTGPAPDRRMRASWETRQFVWISLAGAMNIIGM